jgi:hypothetical protein
MNVTTEMYVALLQHMQKELGKIEGGAPPTLYRPFSAGSYRGRCQRRARLRSSGKGHQSNRGG